MMLSSDIEPPAESYRIDSSIQSFSSPSIPSISLSSDMVTPTFSRTVSLSSDMTTPSKAKVTTNRFSSSNKFSSSSRARIVTQPVIPEQPAQDLSLPYTGSKIAYQYKRPEGFRLALVNNSISKSNMDEIVSRINLTKKKGKLSVKEQEDLESFGTFDAFVGSTAKTPFQAETTLESEIGTKLELFSNAIYENKPNSVTNLFDRLYSLMRYLNSVERAMILNRLVFGGLISYSKMNGASYKPAANIFGNLVSEVGKLKTVESEANTTKLFETIISVIKDNCESYRRDRTAKSQVESMIEFVAKIARLKEPMTFCFPQDDSFNDISGNSSKTINISGKFNVSDLTSFFQQKQETAVEKPAPTTKQGKALNRPNTQKGGKGNKDDDYDY